MSPRDEPAGARPSAARDGRIPATALRRALAILGDPWTMLVLKEAYNGARRFGEFQSRLGIPKQTLSLRLAQLCRDEMLHRRYIGPAHATLDYAPTAKTWDLEDAMISIWLWHEDNRGAIDVLPFDILHVPCGRVLKARYRCRDCRGEANRHTVAIQRAEPEQMEDAARPRLARRNDAAILAARDGGGERMLAASIVGDRPSNEILYLLSQGPAHLKAMGRMLGIGLPVLRARLDKLKTLGLIEERPRGRRVDHRLTAKADGLYPLLISLAAWGERWCLGGDAPPELRVHDCGALLRGRFVCAHCDGWVTRRDIRVVERGARP